MMESILNLLPLAAILWPLMLVYISARSRSGSRSTPWLASAPLPAILAAVFSGGRTLTISNSATMPFALEIDAPGAMLLGASGLLWALAAFNLPHKHANSLHRRRFSVCWLLAMTGNLGVFMAADVMGFIVFYALASLPGYGLVIHEETPRAKRAGKVYLAFALVGEALLIMGLVLLVLNPTGGGFRITEAVASLPDSPWRVATVLLFVAAFGLKIGIVPAHGWLPMAHTVAPTPASAVLSGAILNAGVIGLIRFLPLQIESPGGIWLVAFGFLGAFFGVAVGLRQSNPKAVLAYSSVSQMGFIAAVCGVSMITGYAAITLPLAFYAAHHTLVKGGLFLATGVAMEHGNGRFAWWMAPAVLIGLGLGGLSFTGGWLAKLAVKDAFGYGLFGWLAVASSAATASLMMFFVFRLVQLRPVPSAPQPNFPLMTSWLLMAAAAVAVPWVIHSHIDAIALDKALMITNLWKTTWPVVFGALLGGFLAVRFSVLPVAGGGRLQLATRLTMQGCRRVSESVEFGESFFRRWTVSGCLLVGLVVVIALLLR